MTCPDCGKPNHNPWWCPEQAYREGRATAETMYQGSQAEHLPYGYGYYRKVGQTQCGDYERGIADALEPRFLAMLNA